MSDEQKPPYDTIDYAALQNAAIQYGLQSLIRDILQMVSYKGLPSDHHFYISFKTDSGYVKLPPHLRLQYPEEMTIVLQNSFKALEADIESFSVILKFNGKEERLSIPYCAITRFYDPSVDYGIDLVPIDPHDYPELLDPDEMAEMMEDGSLFPSPEPEEEVVLGEVIQLDKFRD